MHRDGSEIYTRAHVCLPTDSDQEHPRGWTLSVVPLPSHLMPPFQPGVDLEDDILLYGYKPEEALNACKEARDSPTELLQVRENY